MLRAKIDDDPVSDELPPEVRPSDVLAGDNVVARSSSASASQAGPCEDETGSALAGDNAVVRSSSASAAPAAMVQEDSGISASLSWFPLLSEYVLCVCV